MDRSELNEVIAVVRDNNAAAIARTHQPNITGFSPQELAFIQSALLHRMIHYADKMEPLDFSCHKHRQQLDYLRFQYNTADELAQRMDAQLKNHQDKDSAIPVDYTRGKNKLFKS